MEEGIVGMNIWSIIFTPTYWKLFASWIPIFPIGVTIGSIMCIKVAALSLKEGQRLFKRSIFVNAIVINSRLYSEIQDYIIEIAIYTCQ